jgi:hypothetical protein
MGCEAPTRTTAGKQLKEIYGNELWNCIKSDIVLLINQRPRRQNMKKQLTMLAGIYIASYAVAFALGTKIKAVGEANHKRFFTDFHK